MYYSNLNTYQIGWLNSKSVIFLSSDSAKIIFLYIVLLVLPGNQGREQLFEIHSHGQSATSAEGGSPEKGLDLGGNCITACPPNWCFLSVR